MLFLSPWKNANNVTTVESQKHFNPEHERVSSVACGNEARKAWKDYKKDKKNSEETRNYRSMLICGEMIIFDTSLSIIIPSKWFYIKNAGFFSKKNSYQCFYFLNLHLLLCFCVERAQQGHPEAAEALQLRQPV